MASLIVSGKGGKDFEIHPAGVTAARCTRIIDLGTHDGEYKGKAKKDHKIQFGFESATLMGDDAGEFAGKPFLITQRFTASLGEKANLRKILESWRGRKFTPAEIDGFDLKNVLGKACMLNMVHSDPVPGKKQYSNIASIMPLPAGMTCPQAVGELIFFSLGDFDQAAFDKLSDYYKELISQSDEYKAMFGNKKPAAAAPAAVAPTIDDDDIPF
jgi:hypothetical protein